jgi:Zn-dependent protease
MDMTLAQQISIYIIPLIFAITLHEVAHGWVASWCGDQTARLSNRLSLNPINHIDPVGTVIIPVLTLLTAGLMFGWAKPVPVDARNLRHPRRDMALVAAAGPLSNILMGIIWGGFARIGLFLEAQHYTWVGVPLALMGGAGMTVNVWFAILNLVPLPPLDGGRVLVSLLPPRMGYQLSLLEPYSFFILIALLVTGILFKLLGPIFIWTLQLVSAIYGF